MKRCAKSTMLVRAGTIWLAVALFLGLFLLQYLTGGAGLQAFGFWNPSAFTVAIGLAQFAGFVAAACLCGIIGVGLCVHGLVAAPEPVSRPAKQPAARFAFWRQFIARARKGEDADGTLRCVSCLVGLDVPVHICPKCGWTQPYKRET